MTSLSKERIMFLDYAHSLVGLPSHKYRGENVGNTLDWLDCSGLIQLSILEAKLGLPNLPGSDRPVRHSNEFFEYYGKPVHEEHAREGDLVFFSRRFTKVTHIGISLGKGMMIHAPGVDNSTVEIRLIEELAANYLANSPEPEFRTHFSRNPVGYKAPILYIPGARWQKLI
jgi:hypothetical protein